ncbi:MAG: type II secretion system minor pseudopilin GspK [Pseudomonadota bacterium]
MKALKRRQQRGGIIIMFAVLVVALVTIFVTDMAWDSNLDAQRSASLYWYEQSVQVALGAESWTSDILVNDATDTETDHFGEIWALELPPLPLEGNGIVGDVTGSLTDVQGLFNVNNLIDANGATDEIALEQFRRLLRALEIDERYATLVADWIDSDLDPGFPGGAEDSTYTGFVPPYRTANQALSDASELAAIAEMEPEVYAKLKPHIVALPGATQINVNTATDAVLQSLDERIGPSEIERLLEERAEAGFEDFATTFGDLVEPDFLPRIGDRSDFFRLRAIVRVGTVRVTMYSLLHRGQQGSVTPILRTFGTL